MARKLRTAARVGLASMLVGSNTLVHVPPLLGVALIKALVRIAFVRRACDRWLMAIAESWVGCNSWMIDHLTTTDIEVEGLPEPAPDAQVLVVCNHQSWVDIPILQRLFHRRLPLLRFFLKSELIWVPLLGLAWWALDFPFVKRYSRAEIERRPERAGRDLAATRKACEKFRQIPVAIVNFVEGTRFTDAKHAAQGSAYRHLLEPKAGGLAFVLAAMGDSLDTLVDVTLVYPEGRPGLVDLLGDRIPEIQVVVRSRPIPEALRRDGDVPGPEHRRRTEAWIRSIWEEKDRLFAERGGLAASETQ